jgi:acyl-CoA dehydrogenase
MQVLGAMGMTHEVPMERWYRELRIRRVGEGPSGIHRMLIARQLFSRGSSGD